MLICDKDCSSVSGSFIIFYQRKRAGAAAECDVSPVFFFFYFSLSFFISWGFHLFFFFCASFVCAREQEIFFFERRAAGDCVVDSVPKKLAI